jgi:hypothetical protein
VDEAPSPEDPPPEDDPDDGSAFVLDPSFFVPGVDGFFERLSVA